MVVLLSYTLIFALMIFVSWISRGSWGCANSELCYCYGDDISSCYEKEKMTAFCSRYVDVSLHVGLYSCMVHTGPIGYGITWGCANSELCYCYGDDISSCYEKEKTTAFCSRYVDVNLHVGLYSCMVHTGPIGYGIAWGCANSELCYCYGDDIFSCYEKEKTTAFCSKYVDVSLHVGLYSCMVHTGPIGYGIAVTSPYKNQ